MNKVEQIAQKLQKQKHKLHIQAHHRKKSTESLKLEMKRVKKNLDFFGRIMQI